MVLIGKPLRFLHIKIIDTAQKNFNALKTHTKP